MSSPPKVAATRVERRAHRGRVGDVAENRGAADRLGLRDRGIELHVEQRDLGAGRRERARGRGADPAARAGDRHDLAGERLAHGLAELRPARAASIPCRTCRLREIDAKRPIASASVIVAIAASAMSAAIRGVLRGAAKPEQAEARHQHDAGQGVERRAVAAHARVVRREIGAIPGREVRGRRAHVVLEGVELAGFRRRHDQRPVLRADGVVRRHHAGLARSARRSAPLTKCITASPLRNARMKRVHAPSIVASFRLHAPRRIGATSATRRELRRQLRRREDLAAAREPLLGERHHLDHALVGFARIRAEGEDAVLEQDQAFDLRIGVEDIRGLAREAEARHHVRHDAEARRRTPRGTAQRRSAGR